ncbi:MAG: hypothetical protein KAH23_02855 [Kiritimatiellae bacterium]|nr:hypothetical protein [Kiritimatiellia bacterium]
MMKTYWTALVVVFATAGHVFAVEPNLAGKTPEEVYSIYQKAIVDEDLDAYYHCLSEGLRKISKDAHKMIMAPKKQNIATQNIKGGDSSIDGDTATVALMGDDSNGTIAMVKEDGVWKVNAQEKWGGDEDAAPPMGSDITTEFSTAGLKKPGASDPEIKKLAWSVLVESDKVLAQVERANRASENAQKWSVAAKNATTWAAAANNVAKLDEELGVMREAEIEAQDALKKAKGFFDKVENLKTTVQEERQAERRATAEIEAAQVAEENRLKKEKDYQAKTEQEIGSVRAAHIEIKVLLEQHSYKEAYDSLKDKLVGCETEKGKEKMQVLVDRCKLLMNMKIYIIEKINASPYRWGWGVGVSAMDVVGADNKGIKLQRKRIEWSGVSTSQMIKFASHYLKAPEIRGVKLRVLANLNLAAAIFCFENNKAIKAEDFGNAATELYPAFGENLRRLTTPL